MPSVFGLGEWWVMCIGLVSVFFLLGYQTDYTLASAICNHAIEFPRTANKNPGFHTLYRVMLRTR
jgi:hypothetical protein